MKNIPMKKMNRRIYSTLILLLLIGFIFTYRLPFYVQQPGSADGLSEMVDVTDGYNSEGEFHLVTVSGFQPTIFDYLIASFLPYRDISPIEDIIPEGTTDEEYQHYQLMLMDGSKNASLVVAYKAANKHVEEKNNGVYVVRIVENMPAEDKLEMGDRIIQVDDIEVMESNDLVDYVQNKIAGDILHITFERDGEILEENVEVKQFTDKDGVGIGIQLVTDIKVEVDPEVFVDSGSIGGPSAGLMFSLELYNQLVEEDITKGKQIAGTGEIDSKGNVLRIGGVDKKVVAAHKKNMEIFFAPNEKGRENSNYNIAKETAAEIGTDMKIVPVDTFQDALDYLEQLD